MIGDALAPGTARMRPGVMAVTKVNKGALLASRLESDACAEVCRSTTAQQLKEWWESDACRGPWLPPVLTLPADKTWETWAEDSDLYNDDVTMSCLESLDKHWHEQGFVDLSVRKEAETEEARWAKAEPIKKSKSDKCIVS
jgi:hypothetical protein